MFVYVKKKYCRITIYIYVFIYTLSCILTYNVKSPRGDFFRFIVKPGKVIYNFPWDERVESELR